MSDIKTSDLVNVAAGGAGLGLGISGAGAAVVAAAPVISSATTTFAGLTFLSSVGGTTAPAIAVALASNPVGWAIGAGLALTGLYVAAKKYLD